MEMARARSRMFWPVDAAPVVSDAARTVRVVLKRRVPEILRVVLLAHGKPDFGRQRIARESKRKCDLHRRSVRTLAFALEAHHRRRSNPCDFKGVLVSDSIVTFQKQHREAFMFLKEAAIEIAEHF